MAVIPPFSTDYSFPLPIKDIRIYKFSNLWFVLCLLLVIFLEVTSTATINGKYASIKTERTIYMFCLSNKIVIVVSF